MISFNDMIDSSSDEESEDDPGSSSRVFLNHLKKCFIATDKTSFCEQAILPDLKIPKKNKNNILLLNHRINENAYEYIKINKADEFRSKNASRPSKLFSLNSLDWDLNKSVENTNQKKENSLAYYELEIEKSVPNKKIYSWSSFIENENPSPFQIYAKFEAIGEDSNEAKTFNIFVPNDGPENIIKVVIFKTALISDLIGLVCYKYESENREPKLSSKTVENFELKISDELGNIEDDLMIESNQRIGKYGFKFLALVQNLKSLHTKKNKTQVQIFFMDNLTAMSFDFDSENILMKDVFFKINEFKMNQIEIFCPKLAFKLEHVDRIGQDIDLENTYLSDYRKYEFVFYRSNSIGHSSCTSRILDVTSKKKKLDLTRTISESTRFELLFLSKWRKDIFKIELSKDELLMEEITNKKTNFYTIPLKYIVGCNIINTHKTEEEDINSVSYRHIDFESNSRILDDLKTNIEHLIQFNNSPFYWKFQSLAKKSTIKWSRKAYREKNSKFK